MRVLVTGASGGIGLETVTAVHAAGHTVVATDLIYKSGLPVPLQLADLTDDRAIYSLLEGCEAVLHVGNLPQMGAARPRQRVLTTNMAINANVFAAAQDLGVRRITFVSSVQVFSGDYYESKHHRRLSDETLSTDHLSALPLDGNMPARPGINHYAQSKVFAEQMLDALAAADPQLIACSVRFPAILKGNSARWFKQRGAWSLEHRYAQEAGSHLLVDDAAALLVASLNIATPGYRCYLPAQTMRVPWLSWDQLAAEALPNVPVREPLDPLGGLVDLRLIEAETGWRPTHAPIELTREEVGLPAAAG